MEVRVLSRLYAILNINPFSKPSNAKYFQFHVKSCGLYTLIYGLNQIYLQKIKKDTLASSVAHKQLSLFYVKMHNFCIQDI